MADNYKVNDIYVDTILQELYLQITVKQRKSRRLRCAGHIINLYIYTFIIGKDVEKIAREIDTILREGDLKRVGELQRKRRALRRLYNVVKYIRRSPQRRKFFKKQVYGGDLAEFNRLEVSNPSFS